MKISTQEGYGLRILLTLAMNESSEDGLTINQISETEKLSGSMVAKMLRILRLAGFVKSIRGQIGGYSLAMPADEILLSKVLAELGGRLFDESDSENEVLDKLCTDSVDCSIRSLWRVLQLAVDKVLTDLTLKDLIGPKDEFRQLVVERIYNSDHPMRKGCKDIMLKNLEVG